MKKKSRFVCQSCGTVTPKWVGRCPGCQAWDSLVEEQEIEEPKHPRHLGGVATHWKPVPLAEVVGHEQQRRQTGISELDRVLGGGLVPGQAVLIGGDPGVGKSTLVLQALSQLAQTKQPVLYATGEESPQQVKLRADRLSAHAPGLLISAVNELDAVEEALRQVRPAVLAVDSIQTLYSPQLNGAPGSVGQVRECSARLVMLCKRENVSLLLVGHVTKDGALAGPRVMEHVVDTVLYFEGERGVPFRVLRAVKNRFGSTNEVGVFEMAGRGLAEVKNPSELFLAERPVGQSGSVVTVSLEGSRPLLLEVQALLTPSGFATPRRTTLGVDPNRVALLAAVLEKKGGMDLLGMDLFVNIAGGVRVSEPAADLGVVLALASSMTDKAIEPHTLVFGEVGLTGEIRAVSQPDARLAEAAKMGFTRALVPRANAQKITAPKGLRIDGVRSIDEAIDKVL